MEFFGETNIHYKSIPNFAIYNVYLSLKKISLVMKNPELSILMVTYNSMDYIKESIQSLLEQEYINYELIIIDDGSDDETADIIRTFDDERIKYFRNQQNRGVGYSRNLALDYACGRYISFFDSDDLAHPKKFQKQISFLENNNEYGYVGSSVILINEDGKEIKRWPLRFTDRRILPAMVFRNCFVNSAVVFRRNLVKDFRFPECLPVGEDYLLWWELLKRSGAHIIPEYLTQYRQHSKSIMHRKKDELKRYEILLFRILLEDIGIMATDEELEIHIGIRRNEEINSVQKLVKYRDWLWKIAEALYNRPEFSQRATVSEIFIRWMKVCLRSNSNIILTCNGLIQPMFYFSLFLTAFGLKKIQVNKFMAVGMFF